MLNANLKYLREKRKLTQEEVGNVLGVGRSTYSNYEKQSDLPSSYLLKLAKYYQVSINDLLTKDIGAPLFLQEKEQADHILSDDLRILPITVSENQKTNIELVPAKAIAGYVMGMKEANFISELPRFYLPKLPEGTYRAFEIEGDSMPPIQSGYIVVGRFLEHARALKNGNHYILVLRDKGVVFKKVVSEIDKNGHLILASDNSEFLPYSVAGKDVLEAWEFAAFIGFPSNIDMNYILLDKLHLIQQQIALMSSDNILPQ